MLKKKRELAKYFHKLSRLVVKLMDSTKKGILVTNGVES